MSDVKKKGAQLPLVQRESGPILSMEARLAEAFLFLENEPVSLEKLMRMGSLTQEKIEGALSELKEHYNLFMHGMDLVDNQGSYQFLPSADMHDRLKAFYGKRVDRRLSKAALETLSIVAYSQPVTRREIDNIRGVSSDTIVRLLRDREYIKVVGRKDVPGHPCLYGTSRKFLFEFNLSSISALPKLSDIDRQRFEWDDEQEKRTL